MFRVLPLLLAAVCVSAELPTLWMEHEDCDPKLIEGQDANEGEYPYMASLRKYNVTPGHACGASILTSRWALTASHCCAYIKNKPEFYIYTGSIYLSKGGSCHTVETVIMHENYMPNSQWKNDICLIKVAKPFVFSSKVQQITLGPQDWPVKSGDKVTITGWGYTKPNEEIIPDRLQKGVDFEALSNDECFWVTGLNMFSGYLCARSRNIKQCTWNGDSGGPLVKNGVQVGLTSFGFRPYGTGKPTVYCRVTYYINWIKQKLGPDASQLKFV